MFDKLLIFT